jgi:hypothetical protein
MAWAVWGGGVTTTAGTWGRTLGAGRRACGRAGRAGAGSVVLAGFGAGTGAGHGPGTHDLTDPLTDTPSDTWIPEGGHGIPPPTVTGRPTLIPPPPPEAPDDPVSWHVMDGTWHWRGSGWAPAGGAARSMVRAVITGRAMTARAAMTRTPGLPGLAVRLTVR